MKKTHFLQTLYLQKPLILILLIAALSTLPWLGLGDFYTKGEPREAALAISMIEKGEWIIPSNYADEFAYKPPLNHWLISGFSLALNGGEVTPFTSRLPSALAFIAMIGVSFMFFARRRPILESFIACLIVITCFEIHRAAMTTRVDMLLTFFLVAGTIQLYTWSEKRRFGQLVSAWILLSMATLVKGPVGIVLPCLVFGTLLLTQKVNFFRAVGKCVIVALPALLIPLVWYYAAYQVQGDAFFDKVFAENFGRFLRMDTETLGTDYNLGVENPWCYYPFILLAGFLPWTILLVISLFFIKYTKPQGGFKAICIKCFNKIMAMDKVLLFSFIAIVIPLLFFTIPASKRSTYIMLVYPFISIFIARFFIYLAEMKPKAVRISTLILVGICVLMVLVVGLAYAGIINIEEISHSFSKRERTLRDIKIFSDLFQNPGWIGLFGITILILAIGNSIYLLKRKMNVKVLMAGFGVMLAINIFMDSFLLPTFKNTYSPRHFADYISDKYELKDNTYVMNNLLEYKNLYGLNFYLGNNFKNFEKEQPDSGFFIIMIESIDDIKEKYKEKYEFIQLESSDKFNENKDHMLLFKLKRKQMLAN
ncbi:glycosyltransferase family 39 protein [Dysgonomonas sp. ZJ709]|uniref:ArnT family glycosyltransferase n=1 Tax=Dysgonomonas sp. ZJ709 TaxID=2709797 RepID=UPI0013EC6107|nr:glycosyltransferase family 39 protein [Dysgonomonas sp. ZJ709]